MAINPASSGMGVRGPNIASADVQLPAVRDYEQVDREIMATLGFTKKWFLGLAIAVFFMLIGASAWTYQIYWGLGQAGYEPPVMWGVYIITFVFWVGIGHAGTLISAILYLFRAGFRTSIYRAAEAMTVFAVMTAGLFPIIHIGRPWKFFWLIPYPNWRLLWPNFKSPLVWDVFAISTYLTISTTFLFIGLIPDIAVLRDKETNPMRKRLLGVLSLAGVTAIVNGATSRKRICSSPLSVRRSSCPCTQSFPLTLPCVNAGLARINLPAVFRRRCHLLRLRDGVDDRDSDAKVVPSRTLHHAQPPRCNGEGRAVHVDGCWLRIHDRILHCLVQWHTGGAGILLESCVWPMVLGCVDHAALQHGIAHVALVTEAAPQPDVAVRSVHFHQPWHVVRAIRHRRAVALARV